MSLNPAGNSRSGFVFGSNNNAAVRTGKVGTAALFFAEAQKTQSLRALLSLS